MINKDISLFVIIPPPFLIFIDIRKGKHQIFPNVSRSIITKNICGHNRISNITNNYQMKLKFGY